MKNSLIRIGNFFFHHRNHVFPAIMLAAVLLFRPQFWGGSYREDLALDAAGLLVCLWGQVMRVLAVGFFYIKRGGINKQIWAGRLVQYGMFAHCRNPLYLGNILIFCGIVMVFNVPLGYVAGIPAVCFVYLCIILAEEQFLRGKFGAEFDDYAARVNRLWPNWRGFRKSTRDMTFNWKRVLSKEYGTTFGWLSAMIALRAWSLQYNGQGQHQQEIYFLLAGYLPLGLAYASIRWMKKSGRLAECDPLSVDG